VSAIPRLQQVFQYLETAEKANPTDPELNLLKGYMDLILAVNLPFSSPQEAIQRLETYGSPDYLVDRGIALAYRDLKQYDQALRFIDNALKATPDNPELMYLKGQILRIQGNTDKNTGSLKLALDYFNNALKKQEQLPESVKKQLNREHRKVQEEIKSLESTASR
jgi:tetratricopeptide (TPR) repeat protein